MCLQCVGWENHSVYQIKAVKWKEEQEKSGISSTALVGACHNNMYNPSDYREGSDWSFMQLDDGSNLSNRSQSPTGTEVSSRSPSRDERHFGLPNSLDSPVRQDPNDRPVSRSARSAQPAVAHPRGTTVAALVGADHATRSVIRPNPVESRQVAARWNAAIHVNGRRSQRTKQNVDAQRAKCLRRGAQVTTGFQRIQVRLMSGGQLPQGRNTAANRN
ncbi:hypothetical protein CLF_102863 [Clonorchis sinensis]|uniref:Uncharacterized protein n=1 Tax=Clonorchis sinensis TaxID=79923 RepID=G7YN80_CLOSI|nr:hypothetical protein CLF_102863 [Clonorchis sinensis]